MSVSGLVMTAIGVQPGSPHFPFLNQVLIDQVANGEIEKVRHHADSGMTMLTD